MPRTARILAQGDPAEYVSTLIVIAVAFCSGAAFVAVAVFVQWMCQRPRSGAAGPPPVGPRRVRRARGLSPSAVSALPAFAYEKSSADGSGRGCAVCLESVGDGETVRRLPVCKHLFHAECIDMWLYSHSTCPVCRAAAVGEADAAKDAAAAAAAASSGSAGVHFPVW